MIVDPIAIIPAIYELCIFSLAIILTTLVFIRYREKKNDLSRMLFLCNLAFTLAILCSIFGKLVTIFYGTDLSLLDPFPREILGRTRASRFSFGFVGIAGLYAILFRYWVFDKSPNKKIMKGEIAYGIFAILFTIFVFDLNNAIYTIVSFTLIIILMIIAYFPLTYQAISVAKKMEEKVYRNAFISLSLMAVFFLSIFIFFVIDQIVLLAMGWRFSIFYYLAWAMVVFAILMEYLGYITPKSKSKID